MKQDARENLLIAVESLFDLLYLIGEARGEAKRSCLSSPLLPGALPVPSNQRQLGRLWNDSSGLVAPSLLLSCMCEALTTYVLVVRAPHHCHIVTHFRPGLHGGEAAAASKQFKRHRFFVLCLTSCVLLRLPRAFLESAMVQA